MTGRDRISLHAKRTGWTVTCTTDQKPDIGDWHTQYERDGYTVRIYFTAANGVARARLTSPTLGTPARWISGRFSGKADRVIDWMVNPAAVFTCTRCIRCGNDAYAHGKTPQDSPPGCGWTYDMVLSAAREDAPSQDGGPRMTRDEAISHLVSISTTVASELYGERAEEEIRELEQDTRDALEALGVTDSELEAAPW